MATIIASDKNELVITHIAPPPDYGAGEVKKQAVFADKGILIIQVTNEKRKQIIRIYIATLTAGYMIQ